MILQVTIAYHHVKIYCAFETSRVFDHIRSRDREKNKLTTGKPHARLYNPKFRARASRTRPQNASFQLTRFARAISTLSHGYLKKFDLRQTGDVEIHGSTCEEMSWTKSLIYPNTTSEIDKIQNQNSPRKNLKNHY